LKDAPFLFRAQGQEEAVRSGCSYIAAPRDGRTPWVIYICKESA